MNPLPAILATGPVQQAPNLPGGAGTAGGATIAGLLAACWLIAKWKDHIKGDTRKYVIVSIIATACLAYGGGVVAQMIGTINQTAGTVGTTLTQTTTGQ